MRFAGPLCLLFMCCACDGALRSEGGPLPEASDPPLIDASTDSGVTDSGNDARLDEPSKPFVVVKRLTNEQFENTLDDVLRQPEREPLRNATHFSRVLKLPKVAPIDIFGNEVDGLIVGSGTFEVELEAAERLATWVRARPTLRTKAYAECEQATDPECAALFIDEMGPKFYRRPLYDSERQSLNKIYNDVYADAQDDQVAYEALIIALMLSPQTRNLLESNDQALHAWFVASRLSYFLWGGPPDDELYDTARDGSLLDPLILRAQAERMMQSPKFKQVIGQFIYELLDLTRFDSYYKSLSLDKVVVRAGMKEDFFHNASRHYQPGATLTDLLTQQNEFIDPLMLTYYQGVYPGILTHPVFQWTHSAYRSTSAIERGVVVRERLIMCAHLPAPPMDVSAIQDNVDPEATGRERLAAHRAAPECSSCHELIDPVGLTFEGYDSNGLHRTQENGMPVDVTGGLTGTSVDKEVNGPLELQQILANSPEVQQCFVDQTLRFVLARKLQASDDALRQETTEHFKASNLELRELILHLATSPLILFPWPQENK